MSAVASRTDHGTVRDLIREIPGLSEHDLHQIEACLLISQEVWVGAIDSKFACAWGLIPPSLLSTYAYLWLIVNPAIINEHEFTFVRRSQIIIRKHLEEYDAIVGHVSVDNHSGYKWLKWLGATFGKLDNKLIPFMIKKGA